MNTPQHITCYRIPRFINVGEDPLKKRVGDGWIGRRQWLGCIKYGFISAGQGTIYSRPLESLKEKDIVLAFITGRGYVGIGRVINEAVPISKFLFEDNPLNGLKYLKKSLFDNSENEKSEYAIKIEWIKTVDKANYFWEKNTGLYASRSTQCSLENQPKTIQFVEKCFNVKFDIQ